MPRPARLPYQPALDGLRGLSVLAVLLFHADIDWASGGYLGVSTFFTLSGFLITTLLLREHATGGRIHFGRFWARRFRRLMPAAIVVLAGIAVYGWLVATPSQLSRLRLDVLSSLAYVSNWRFMGTGHSYFEIFTRPSPVQHFWSLSIEEQFYAGYPLLVAASLALWRGRRGLLGVLALLTVASAALGPLLWLLGASSSRIYYGTDTRIFEILAGSLLALACERRGVFGAGVSATRQPGSFGPGRVDLLGGAALALVCADFVLVQKESAALYQGVLVLHAAASTALIAAAVAAGRVARLLSPAALVWLGRISYGVYLYHWPVYLWLDAERTGLDTLPLLALRLGLTLAISQLSYSLLEMPIRSGRLLAGARTWIAAPIAAAAVMAATVYVTIDPPLPWHVTHGPWQLRAMPARQPDAPAGPTRIMMIGDSVGWNVGIGLDAWAAQNPSLASSWNMASFGCGVARGGRRPGVPRNLEQLGVCDSWADWWEVQLDAFRPDVVVVHSGSWDIIDREQPGWGRIRTPGDPVFDDWLVSEYQQAVDLLSSRGAHVVWLTLPCYGKPPMSEPMRDTGAFDQERHRHLREVIVPRLEESRAGRVSVYDLFAKVCPYGTYVKRIPGAGEVRSDHAHLSLVGARWVAEELGPLAIEHAGFDPRRLAGAGDGDPGRATE